jgi:protein SCO1/2
VKTRRALLAAFTAGVALPFVGACSKSGSPSFKATDITGASFARDFQLVDHDGTPRMLADFGGKVVVVFFGFTHCPDVCPTALVKLKAVMDRLGPDAARVQVLLVTVDPERDSPQLLKAYTTDFHPSFLGLTGTPEQVEATVRGFNAIAIRQPGASADTYTVDHTSAMYVFDARGRVRLYVAGNADADSIASDLAVLLASG